MSINFEQGQYHNELQNSKYSVYQSNLSEKSQISLYLTSISQQNQISEQQVNLQQQGLQISAKIDGLIIQVDQETLQALKERKIEDIKKALGLIGLKFQVNIPEKHIRAQANGLMDIRSEQVKKDISIWLGYDNIQHVYQNKSFPINNEQKQYNFIRYFYFKNSESYQKENPDQDYGKQIVKYKNQITVLIGIIENFLNQPIQYFGVFKSFQELFQNFQRSQYATSHTASDAQELMNILLYLTKERIDSMQKPDCTYQINQKFYLYLNSKYEPFEVLMKFVKFLLQTHNIEYKSEDMSIFWRVFKVAVISYFDCRVVQIGTGQQQKEMQLSIVFERIQSLQYDFQNCYLLYDSLFQDSYKETPFECLNCKVNNLNSIKYVKEFPIKGRLCFNCQ
ncbi:hypothetical protein ABPG72_022225 [Tetrahymena utriculariae]